MKTPCNHYFDLGGKFYHSSESVLRIASAMFRSYEALFEAAVAQKTTLKFEFDESDFEYLRGQFPGVQEETMLVREFLDGIINQRLKFPFSISTVFWSVGSNVFGCRVDYRLPMYD